MHLLKQSTAASVLVGPVLDSTGAVYTAAVIGDFTLVKNGTSAALATAATATHDGNGHYILALTTGNTDTLGRAAIYCNKATYTMSISRFSVLPAATFDALITNVAGAANGLPLSLASNKVNVATCDTLTTYTGNTPQTGDAYSRLGAPAGASVSADVAAVKGDTATIMTDVNSGGGAIYTRLGTPAGASLAADIASVKTSVGTVTNLTNAPTAGDLTATMKASVTTAASAATPAVTVSNKTGFSLAATGLDAITASDPAGVASTFPQMVVQLWRRFFKKSAKNVSSHTIITYKDDGTTAETTQTFSDDGAGTETLGAAS